MFEAVDGLMHEQSCTWWAPSAAQDKKGRSTAGAPSAGSVKTGHVGNLQDGLAEEARRPRLVHVHPYCRLQPARLSPDPPAQGRTVCSPQKRQDSCAGLW